MIVQIEIKGPVRIKPKRELASYGWRFIWLWFSIAYYPRFGINEMAKAFREAGKQELVDAGWKAP